MLLKGFTDPELFRRRQRRGQGSSACLHLQQCRLSCVATPVGSHANADDCPRLNSQLPPRSKGVRPQVGLIPLRRCRCEARRARWHLCTRLRERPDSPHDPSSFRRQDVWIFLVRSQLGARQPFASPFRAWRKHFLHVADRRGRLRTRKWHFDGLSCCRWIGQSFLFCFSFFPRW